MGKLRNIFIYFILWIGKAYIIESVSPDSVPQRVIKPIRKSKVLHLGQSMQRWRNAYNDESLTNHKHFDFKTKSDCV